ncbi:MAG: hypothetical protein WC756_03905 [Taibaiella sp.]|jgi:hypothetical protein
MLSRNKIFLVIPMLIFAISCSKKSTQVPDPICEQPVDSCSYWQDAAGLVSISGPATASVGQQVQFIVVVTGRNGCATSALVNGAPFGNNIALTGNVHYVGCMCTQALVDLSSTYSFTPAQPGIYLLQGETYEGAPVTHTLTVQ